MWRDLERDLGRVLFVRSGSVLHIILPVTVGAAATSSKCTWRVGSEFHRDWLKFRSLGAYSRYAIATTFSGFCCAVLDNTLEEALIFDHSDLLVTVKCINF